MAPPFTRYVLWLERRWLAITLLAGAALAASLYLTAFHLPVRADLSNLLPQDVPAIRDLRRLEARLAARDTMLAVVVADRPGDRAAAAAALAARIRALDPALVERVEADDDDIRAFLRAHRHLYVPLADLEAADRALADALAAARLRANPLFVELDDDDGAPLTAHASLDDLRARRRAAEARLERPTFVSTDGRTQVIVIKTAFRATDVDRDRQLAGALAEIRRELGAAHPATQIAFTGGVITSLVEHDALVEGMLLSSLVTAALVLLVLWLHLRSARVLILLGGNLVVGTVVAFGLAALTVGHLNAATAFLGAIIAGNGVNYGILLVARYLEERPADAPAPAMARAIAGTLRPTLVASLGAAIAYGALGVTRFQGFADFAWIGGAGMLVCWLASFLVLPALLLRFARAPRTAGTPLFGALAVRLFTVRRPLVACVVGGVLVAGAAGITWRYLADDAFEYDMARVRSDAPAALEARRWMRHVDAHVGRGLAGVAGTTYVAVDDLAALPAVVRALGVVQAADPIVGSVTSLLDVVPPDQGAKVVLLDRIRAALDEAGDALPEADAAELRALRPADDLRAITAADLPAALRARLVERDGRIGYLIAVRPGPAFDEWDGRDLIAFARAVRSVPPSAGTVTTAGPSLIFADILTTIRHDGPIVTLVAALALIGMVLVVVGRTRNSLAVLVGTAAGSLAMIAVSALIGLKINFLDFVALPITLGLGIDYAINVAERATRDDPTVALRSTGGSVLVCSLTTVIGYGSLLISSNLAIRGFGLASLIGEVTCVIAALTLVPAIIAVRRPARVRAPALAIRAQAA